MSKKTLKVRLRVNWGVVKALGQLTVLTRASYMMLIIVPIMAGIWPGVRTVLNRYNQAVTDTTMLMDTATQRLDISAERLKLISERRAPGYATNTLNSAVTALYAAEEQVRNIADDYSLKVLEKTSMPSVWVIAFLASLAVMVGHLLYESLVPDLIKQNSLDTYIQGAKRAYVEAPADNKLEYCYVVNREALKNPFLKSFVSAIHPIEDSDRNAYHVADDQEGLRKRELGVVAQGAECEYYMGKYRSPGAASIAMLFYGMAMIAVFYIIVTQCINVLRVAEWL
ncbi:MAG: hypothetical protein HN341_11915 [Verrucomicrobia bacterium]|jgi:hypothetical protein|nr:hypothetical protein [Verrucomicrobiota bacterium]